MRPVWQEPNFSGKPRRLRTAVLPVSNTCTWKPSACRYFTQSWQQPQLGSFQT